MSIRNWTKHEIVAPRGAWTFIAPGYKGRPERATYAQNMRVSPKGVINRAGTSSVFSSSGKVTGMYNWISPTDNFVIYQDGSAIKRRQVSSGTTVTLLGSGLGGTRAPSVSDLGPRAYFCGYDTSGNGTIQANVHDGASGTDTCFRGPLTLTTLNPVDIGAGGLCTQGLHNFALIFQSRSGFAGNPSSTGGYTFTPSPITLSSGNRKIQLNITLDTPSDAGTGSALYVIMTPVDNPTNYFFVPGAQIINLAASFPGFNTALLINISDEDLVQQTSAAAYFNYLVQTVGGAGPITPSYVMAYGTRMTYGVGTQVYVSEINNPQAITADENIVKAIGQRQIGFGFPLGVNYYLTGNNWTSWVADNGDLPSTWPQPKSVSEYHGAPFPCCVEWKTRGEYVWMATEAGVHCFNGTFADNPITYFWSDYWQRVNWSVAYVIQMTDDVVNKRLYVGVPLDSATECSHQFCIDYTRGRTFDTCDITLDLYNATSFPTFSAIRMVKEANGRSALWVAPSAAGTVGHSDSTTTNDLGNAVDFKWKSGLMRQADLDSTDIRVGACNYWARGSGSLIRTWAGLDGVLTVTPPNSITLTATPGQELFDKADLSPVENFTIALEVNQANGALEINGIRAYSRRGLEVR